MEGWIERDRWIGGKGKKTAKEKNSRIAGLHELQAKKKKEKKRKKERNDLTVLKDGTLQGRKNVWKRNPVLHLTIPSTGLQPSRL